MIIKIKKINTKKLFWSLYVFVLIFAPPFMPYPHLVLAAISGMLLVTKYRKYWRLVFKNSYMKNWLAGMCTLFIYIFLIPLPVSMILDDIVNMPHYISLFNRFGVLVCTIIPCAGLMLSVAEKEKWEIDFVIGVIIHAGMIEGVSAILAFLFPTVKSLFLNLTALFANAAIFENSWYITVRSYGFAGTLVDVFGYGVALIAGVCFGYGIVEKRRYMAYSLIIAVAALLNARTGVVLYISGLILALGYFVLKKNIKAFFVTVTGVVLIAIMAGYAWKIISSNTATAGWITNGFDGFFNIFKGEEVSSGSMGALMRQNQSLPGGVRTLIGTAHSLYGAGNYRHSDIGYINDIWMCGILGCLLLYGMIIKMTVYILKNLNNTFVRFIAIYNLFCLFSFNMKACSIGYNPGAATSFLLLFLLRYYAYLEENKERKNLAIRERRIFKGGEIL